MSANVSVGLMEGCSAVEVEIDGVFRDSAGRMYAAGRHRFTSGVTLTPDDAKACSFALDDVTIGIGFHWERKERQAFRGALRIIEKPAGLTIVNDVPLEEYVTSVISSEMSASCPIELLKAHAVISRSWLLGPASRPAGPPPVSGTSGEHIRWYGREAHDDFTVCADDHCQRYQGITKAFSAAASEAVDQTRGERLTYGGEVCDARFSKCCGGVTERYSTAWEDRDFPYLQVFFDGPGGSVPADPEALIRSESPAYCNTRDAELLAQILPGFDQETRDFFRWRVEYSPEEMGELIHSRIGIDLGAIRSLESLSRGPSGRIYRLKVVGEKAEIIIGKELEIRRALSRSHLYSSAFVVDREDGRFVLRGAGWGHGVGLCQIGAAVIASQGKSYIEILAHYYRGAVIGV
jgi:stage II sporulation protein D